MPDTKLYQIKGKIIINATDSTMKVSVARCFATVILPVTTCGTFIHTGRVERMYLLCRSCDGNALRSSPQVKGCPVKYSFKTEKTL
jgi:hypothetical protein